MRNLMTLYRYEFRKILNRKLQWITLAVILAVSLLTVISPLFGQSYVDGTVLESHYEAMRKDSAYARALNGRPINQTLLSEMQDAYRKIPLNRDRYSMTKEYQTWARPYSAVFQFADSILGFSDLSEMQEWEADEDALYAARLENVKNSLRHLSEKEQSYWLEQDARLPKPFVFRYAEGYWSLGSCFYTLGLEIFLLIAICLSGIFSDEHTRRTDQLLLSSSLGKKELYRAKLLAGISYALLCAALLDLLMILTGLSIYGFDGFSAPIQFASWRSSMSLSAGQLLLILSAPLLAASAVTAAFVMLLSAALNSSIGALSVNAGLILMTMFLNIPEEYRLACQLFDLLPSNMVSVWGVLSTYLTPFFGSYLTLWQLALPVYAVFAVLFSLAGRRAWSRYQVSGR